MKARRSESVKGLSLTSSRQEKVAVPLVQDVLDRLRDQVEGPFGVVELDLSALDAGKPGFQRAGQAADRGIAGHDLDQGRGGFELAGDLADLFHRQEQQAVLFEELAGAERLHRFEMSWCRRRALSQAPCAAALVSSGVGASTTARIGLFPVERLLELVVALAPVQIGRNQRVDVGVDGEVPGRVEARPDRKEQREEDNEGGKPRTGSNNRDNNTVSAHSFLSSVKKPARKRPLSSGVP